MRLTQPFARVLVQGAAHHCLVDGDRARLLDRPAYEDGARETGVVGLAHCRLLAPVQPSKVVAVGLNYRTHAEEFHLEIPEEPILFLKPPSCVIGHGDAIVLPPDVGRVDYEAELAVVMGRRCHGLAASTAAEYVAGYTCANDVTARRLQKRDGQWSRAKGFDTFCPLGPWIVTDLDPADLEVIGRVNGEVRQRGRTRDLLFPIPVLIEYASAVMTLEPGDVILTGTPAGVGPLAPGDVVEVEVPGLGVLRNPVHAG